MGGEESVYLSKKIISDRMSILQLWDVETDNVAVVTHAFIVRWTSPLDTGNYVPEGKSKPDNLTEGSRRSEPGPNVQLSVAFDCKSDDSVHRSLAVSISSLRHTSRSGHMKGQKID